MGGEPPCVALTTSDYDTDLTAARTAIESGDYTGARKHVVKAQIVLARLDLKDGSQQTLIERRKDLESTLKMIVELEMLALRDGDNRRVIRARVSGGRDRLPPRRSGPGSW